MVKVLAEEPRSLQTYKGMQRTRTQLPFHQLGPQRAADTER